MKIVGKTKSAGFQVGVRKTYPYSLEDTWAFLFSSSGITLWLGEIEDGPLREKGSYRTRDNFEGQVKVLKPYAHIRLTWKRPEWQNTSTLQIRCIASKPDKTVISIHQEKLDSKEQREEMKEHWTQITIDLEKKMNMDFRPS